MTPETKERWLQWDTDHREQLARDLARKAYQKALEESKEVQGFGNWFPGYVESQSLSDLLKWRTDSLRRTTITCGLTAP